MPPQASAAKDDIEAISSMSESQLVEHICAEVQKVLHVAIRREGGFDHLGLEKMPEVEVKDVISVADARKSTGYMESIGYSLKRLVWA